MILPQYFSSGTTTRMAICLVMHPIALESAEAFSRLNKSSSVLALLRKGKLTPEKARRRAVENSMDAFFLKVMMAFYRRMQVLWAQIEMLLFTKSPHSLSQDASKPG